MTDKTWVTNLLEGVILLLVGSISFIVGDFCLNLIGGAGEILLLICVGSIPIALIMLVLIFITFTGIISFIAGISEITKALLRRLKGDKDFYESLWSSPKASKSQRP